MKEKYESLALVQLRELAKVRGLKGTSSMKKADLVEAMLAEDERQKKQETENAPKREAAQQKEESAPKTVQPKAESAPKREAAQQSNESAPESSRKKNIVTNKRPASSQQRNLRAQKTVMDESSYKAEPAAAAESPRKADEPLKAAEQPAAPQSAPAAPAAQNNTAAPTAQRTPRSTEVYDEKTYPKELDSGEEASGILEVMPDGYGFIRCENYLPGENDVYVAPSQIRRFGLKTGDILRGNKRIKTQQEKFSALLFIRTINGYTIEEASKRKAFEDMTPIFPDERIKLETPGCSVAMRVMDLVSPIGRGQRGMIVSPPKAGKTTLLKEVAKSILRTNPDVHMLILLIDERPEEVTDVKEAIIGTNVEVIYSTFDELPEHHKRVSEMVIERAKRLVEHKKDVIILLDSITRLARAYNLVVPPSGRTLSGGLDPAALHMPKRFFGAARNMRGGGSLTILATALVDTGSKMDDVIYEEFKSTGNMEMILDRKLSEKRIFPAIDLAKSGTRREDLLLSSEELDAINIMRRALNGLKSDEATDRILDMFARTRNNNEFVQMVKRNKFI
ncbi:transcription termination factor Rho [Acetatifactor aquisgranensis]|uniref:transcription termination factor Rho n=1 Tax=Acetatifactor aquisgranensis TaxID=2941233 RepID=UPI0020405CDB|nr:transcription termination factor Rho [Acetatifactor aquisgranensis]